MSNTNAVTVKGRYLAIVSTTVETDDPEAELGPGLQLLGKIDKKFVWVSEQFEPQDDGKDSKVSTQKKKKRLVHSISTLYTMMIQFSVQGTTCICLWCLK